MSFEIKKNSAGGLHVDRQLIRVDNAPDQAGIAAALRRAFVAGPVPACFEDDLDPFAALLKQPKKARPEPVFACSKQPSRAKI